MKVILTTRDKIKIIDDVSSWEVDDKNNLCLHMLYSEVGELFHESYWEHIREYKSD